MSKDATTIINFSGVLKYEKIQSLITELTQKLIPYNFSTAVRKKILNITVECLENIYKYTDPEPNNNNLNLTSVFSVSFKDNEILISSGNILQEDQVEKIKSRIDLINHASRDELLNAYEDIINNGQISDKGGAGLGLIDMALKSGNCLECSFTDTGNNTFYYDLKVKVDINK